MTVTENPTTSTAHDELTPMHIEILLYIAKYHGTHGYPPAVREIGKAVGLSSSSTIHFHLQNLEEMGHICTQNQRPRTIRLILPAEED